MIKKYTTGLRGTILRYVSLTAIIPLLIILPGFYLISRHILLSTAKQNMMTTSQYILKMCETQSGEIDKRYDESIGDAYKKLKNRLAGLSNLQVQDEPEELTVTNQSTGEKTTIRLPIMSAGNDRIYNNFSIVDSMADQIGIRGATSTIFQLNDDKLIRISTNVKGKDGKRALLTYIPKESLVYRTISEGKPYRGRAVVLDTWSITHYEPLKNDEGRIIGAFYIGVPAPKSAIFDMISQTKIGRSGYVYVINSLGQAIEHPTRKGEMLIDQKDSLNGTAFINDIIDKKEGFFTYNFPDKNGEIEKKIAFAAFFPKWDWIIVSTAALSDLLRDLSLLFGIITLLLVILPVALVIVSSVAANRIFAPLKKIIETAVKVSDGDLKVFIPQPHYTKCAEVKDCKITDCPAHDSRNKSCWRIDGTFCDNGKPLPLNDGRKKMDICCECKVYKRAIRNESDALIEAINNMIVTIRNMISNMTAITEELNTESNSLSEISSKMLTESQSQAAFIEETTSSNEELMATIENVANSAKNQAHRVSQTSAAMEELTSSTKIVGDNATRVSAEAKESVRQSHQTEGMLNDTTKTINQVAESSKKIVDIVAMINDISDQINLLSLNAAIEAARAGEQGKGFAVVSQEISKLADATASSTKEIENVIKNSRADIQKGADLVNSTAGSITDMIKKIEIAAKLFEDIAVSSDEQIRGSEQVMKDVEEISAMSDQIAMATGEQKVTSTEILNALTRVNSSIQEIAQSSQTVSNSAQALKKKAERMNEIIHRFRT